MHSGPLKSPFFGARIWRAQVSVTEAYKPASAATYASAPSAQAAEGSPHGVGGCSGALWLGPAWSAGQRWPSPGRWRPPVVPHNRPRTRRSRRRTQCARRALPRCPRRGMHTPPAPLPPGSMHSVPSSARGLAPAHAPAPCTVERARARGRPISAAMGAHALGFATTRESMLARSDDHDARASSCEGHGDGCSSPGKVRRAARGGVLRAAGSC